MSIPPGLVADLFVVWSTTGARGRPHKVYAIGPVVLAEQVPTVPFAATSAWMAFIEGVERLVG